MTRELLQANTNRFVCFFVCLFEGRKEGWKQKGRSKLATNQPIFPAKPLLLQQLNRRAPQLSGRDPATSHQDGEMLLLVCFLFCLLVCLLAWGDAREQLWSGVLVFM